MGNLDFSNDPTNPGFTPSAPAEESTPVLPASRAQRTLRILGWSAFAVGCLLLFTLLKLPEIRLKNFIQGSIQAALGAKGITFSAAQTRLSMGFGVTYAMKDVTLNLPPPQPSVKIEEIEVSPSIASLLFGRMGGKLYVKNGDGTLKGSFSLSNGKTQEISVSFKAKSLDAGKLGLLPIAAGMGGGMTLNGEGSVSGDLNNPSSLSGSVKLDLTKIYLDQQSLMGFNLPRIALSEGTVDLAIESSKAVIKNLRLGKTADGLVASATGNVTLGKQWESSTLDLKAKVVATDAFLDAISPLIKALITSAKQSDGAYAWSVTGPVSSPNAQPVRGQ